MYIVGDKSSAMQCSALECFYDRDHGVLGWPMKARYAAPQEKQWPG